MLKVRVFEYAFLEYYAISDDVLFFFFVFVIGVGFLLVVAWD